MASFVETDPAEQDGALIQLRAYLAQHEARRGTRLPPERELCRTLGVSRSALRKALALLETEGRIWRHVGRGTFVGNRPLESMLAPGAVIDRVNPAQVMEARMHIEPELARLAALHATRSDLEEMRRCMTKSRQSRSWRVYETWDNNLHRAIACATHNPLLLSLFDSLNAVRRAVVWGRLRATRLPAPEHHSFDDHEALVDAIAERDLEGAAACMRAHLCNVRARLTGNGVQPARSSASAR